MAFAGENGTEDEEALSAEFRHRIGMLQSEEELSDAFKARLGLGGLDEFQETHEISIALDWEKDTMAGFKFAKFAKQNFQGNNTHKWQPHPLVDSLMAKQNDIDRKASLAVFLAIQRFMGDIDSGNKEREKMPVMTKIYRMIESKTRPPSQEVADSVSDNSPPAENIEGFKLQKKYSVKKLFGSKKSTSYSNEDKEARKNKDKHNVQMRQGKENGHDKSQPELRNSLRSKVKLDLEELLAGLPSHELDLVHFVVGHGILRQPMRDEILCQVCKQLTDNPKQESQKKGWMLLILSLGSFLPTEKFLSYLKCFIQDAPVDYKATLAESAKNALRRTLANGPRYHPPNWLEFTGLTMRKVVMLPVTLADGAIHTIETDAATTAEEMCRTVAKKIDLKDLFGFSIYICIYNTVSSLGSGSDHVMDAIAECEQIVRSKGQQEADAPWRLFFRKELFSPWHDPGYDEYATSLVYCQVTKGLRTKEYRMNENDIPTLLAKIFYIEFNGHIVPGKIQQDLQKYLPQKHLEGEKSRDHWTQSIIGAVHALHLNPKSIAPKLVKEDFIKDASNRWALQFSGLFESFCISGPPLPRNDVVVAINHMGLFIMHEPFKVAASVEYCFIIDIFSSRTSKERGQTFNFSTLRGEEYSFVSPNAQNITSLVSTFIEGLRRRSRYAVGLQNYHIQAGTEREPFDFKQGDVLLLLESEPECAPKKSEWVKGLNERTGRQGIFPLESVYVLPTIEKPSPEVARLIKIMTSTQKMTLPRRKDKITLTPPAPGKKTSEKEDSRV